jgi:phage portal protein BeeE
MRKRLFPRRRKSLLYSDNGAAAITVTPGDALYEQLAGATRPLTVETAARAHWAVASCQSILARGITRIPSAAVMVDARGARPVREDRLDPILRPHLATIIRDLVQFGDFVGILADDEDGTPRSMVRVNPLAVEKDGKGDLVTEYRYGGETYKPDQVFRVYFPDPVSAKDAVSPLQSLLPILEEDLAASSWRKDSWTGFNPSTIVERPIDAPDWSTTAMTRFANAMKAKGAGDVAVLEEGMIAKHAPLPDASSAQYLESRRFASEAVASVLCVPGVLLATGDDRQLGPARRQLIADGVAPLAEMITEASKDLALRVYGQQALNGRIRYGFDVPAAMRAESEDSSLTNNAVGRPWRTVNEQRRAEGLTPVAGGDELADPVTQTVVTKAEAPDQRFRRLMREAWEAHIAEPDDDA